MMLDVVNWRPKLLPACVVKACLLVVGLAMLVPAHASRADPLNLYNSFTDSGPVSADEKARREHVRSELYDRYSADYQMSVPFVSQASIGALQQAIDKYQAIVQAGGWPAIGDKVTLRPGDTAPVSYTHLTLPTIYSV